MSYDVKEGDRFLPGTEKPKGDKKEEVVKKECSHCGVELELDICPDGKGLIPPHGDPDNLDSLCSGSGELPEEEEPEKDVECSDGRIINNELEDLQVGNLNNPEFKEEVVRSKKSFWQKVQGIGSWVVEKIKEVFTGLAKRIALTAFYAPPLIVSFSIGLLFPQFMVGVIILLLLGAMTAGYWVGKGWELLIHRYYPSLCPNYVQ